jgi:transcriptional regulator with XRE-family HTH domain
MGHVRNEDLLKAIGRSFKKLREEAGLSQDNVFEATGIHVGRIETARTNVTISTVEELCRYYGVSLQQFFQALKF